MQRFLRNVASNYFVAAIDAVILVILTPYVVHQLGIVHYSIWIIVQTLGFYLSFLDLGIADAQVRQHAQLRARGSPVAIARLHDTCLSFHLAAGMAGILLAGLVFVLPLDAVLGVPEDLGMLFPYFVVIAACTNCALFLDQSIDGIYEGEERFDAINIVHVAVSIVEFAAIVAVLYAGMGLLALLSIQLVFALASFLVKTGLLARLLPRLERPRPIFHVESWNSIRHYSLWNSLNEFMTEGTAQFDKLLIPILLTTSLVAPYSLVVLVAAVIFAVVEPITDTYLPMFSRHSGHRDRNAASSLLFRGSRLVVAVSLPAAIVICVFGNALLDLWVGPQYSAISNAVLWFTALNFFFSTYLWTPLNVLMAAGRIKEIFLISVLEVAVILALILLLVPYLGLSGLALAGLVANVAIGVAFFIPKACEETGDPLPRYLMATLLRPALAVAPVLVLALALAGTVDLTNWIDTLLAASLAGLLCFAAIVLFAMPGRERIRYFVTLRRAFHAG